MDKSDGIKKKNPVKQAFNTRLGVAQQPVIVIEPNKKPTVVTVQEAAIEDEIAPWPDDLSEKAFHGLVGDIIRSICPYSEADDAALLVNFLIAFGNIIGSSPHFKAGPDTHRLNMFGVLVGESSKGRKGMSWSWARELLRMIDEPWALHKTPGGLSTGEGLIWEVRDEIKQKQAGKQKERGTDYEYVIVEPGVEDKRLLVVEEEFASVLKVATRQGNTLSPIIRRAWDTGVLGTLTKNSPAKATGAHISIIAHITKAELNQTLTATDSVNGFANRFLWVCARRSKFLPDGVPMPQQELNRLAIRVEQAFKFARTVGKISRDSSASERWREVYPELSKGKPGLLGAILGRGEAQVMRLAAIYALLDLKDKIEPIHLEAALAVWHRCEQSAHFIFGGKIGNPIADKILVALATGPKTQTEILRLFNCHITTETLRSVLQTLSANGKIHKIQQETDGRSKTVWQLNSK